MADQPSGESPRALTDLAFIRARLAIAEAVIREFICDINSTGGLIWNVDLQQMVPDASQDWSGLAITYLKACGVLEVTPVYDADNEDEADEADDDIDVCSACGLDRTDCCYDGEHPEDEEEPCP
jgi:hypothetical protein